LPLDPSCRFGVTNNTGNLTIHRHPGSRLQLTAAIRTSVCDREPGYPNQILIHTSCSCCSRRSVGNDASCVPNNQQSTFSQPSTTRLPPPSPQCPKLLPTGMDQTQSIARCTASFFDQILCTRTTTKGTFRTRRLQNWANCQG
jgi:hypothetical protein